MTTITMVLPCCFVEMLNLKPLLTPVTCFIAQGVEAGAQQTSEAWWKIQSLKFVFLAVLKDKTDKSLVFIQISEVEISLGGLSGMS